MAGELSSILEPHREDRRARPRRRAADVARRRGRQRAARRRAAAVAAARGRARAGARHAGRRLPRPEPAAHESALIELTAAQAAERDRAPASSPRASCSRPTASAPRPTSSTPSCGSPTRRPSRAATGPLARRAARRSRTCSAPRASRARPARGSSRATGRRTPRRSSSSSPTPARRCWARPTRTSSRWARRTRTPAYGPVLNPWDRTRVPGRLERRQRRGGRRRPRAVGAGHRHRRLDPPARRAVRDRRAQAHLRRRQPLRDDRLRLVARPGRPADARRHRLRAAVPPHDRRDDPRDSTSLGAPRGDRAAQRRAPRRHPPRRARGAHGRGHRAGRARALRARRSKLAEELGATVEPCRCRTRRTASAPTT